MEKPRQTPRHPLVVIPARMTSTRLPGKPLAAIGGEPMIVHVWRRAVESGVGPVLVACDSMEIVKAVEKAGGKAVLTRPDHPSGSDRIWEALNGAKDNESYDAVVNMQGDLPLIDPKMIRATFELLQTPVVDIATLAVEIKNDAEKTASQVVKIAMDLEGGKKQGRALYFSRLPVPSGEGPLYHHIGLYAYRRDALARFVEAAPSPLEMREKLEQLRALSLGMRIEVGLVETIPFGVDTPEDLEKARKLMEGTKK